MKCRIRAKSVFTESSAGLPYSTAIRYGMDMQDLRDSMKTGKPKGARAERLGNLLPSARPESGLE